MALWHAQGFGDIMAPMHGPEEAGRCHWPAMPRPVGTRSLALPVVLGQPPAAEPQEGAAAAFLHSCSLLLTFKGGLWRSRVGIRSCLLLLMSFNKGKCRAQAPVQAWG